jgi:hypothetical protein
MAKPKKHPVSIGKGNSVTELLKALLGETKKGNQRREDAENEKKAKAKDAASKLRPDERLKKWKPLKDKIKRLEDAENGTNLWSLGFQDFCYPKEPKESLINWRAWFTKKRKEDPSAEEPKADEDLVTKEMKEWACEPVGALKPSPSDFGMTAQGRRHFTIGALFAITLAVWPLAIVCGILLPGWQAYIGAVIASIVTIFCSICARFSANRLAKSDFDLKVLNALEQAKTSLYPWEMARWLGISFDMLTKHNPLLFPSLFIFDSRDNDQSPNHINFFLNRLVKAGKYVLSGFKAQGERGADDRWVGENRYNELMEAIIKALPDWKVRWVQFYERLAIVISLFATFSLLVGLGFLILMIQEFLGLATQG